jgi:hypothetical protein
LQHLKAAHHFIKRLVDIKLTLIIIIFIWLILPFGYSNSPKEILKINLSRRRKVYSVVKLNKEYKLVNIVWIKGNLVKLKLNSITFVMSYEEYYRIKQGEFYIKE